MSNPLNQNSPTHPARTVTVAIPAWNEAATIAAVVQRFLQSAYPNLVQVLVSDGGSTDGTCEQVKQLAAQDSRVTLLHNPAKIQSHALNQMLAAATGDIFLRADAHCDYAPDYIERCVTALQTSGALNVGGAQRFVAQTPFQAGIALASRSPLGNGGAKYRDPHYSGFADTVFLGCFWRKTLEDLNGFNTEAVTNQDAELNLRLLAQQPNAIYVSADIQVWYYPRRTPQALWRQYFRYGRGRVLTAQRHPGRSPLRTRLPALGLGLLLLILLGLALLINPFTALLLTLGLALLPFFLESCRLTLKFRPAFQTELWRGKDRACPPWPIYLVYCWLSLVIMPLAYTLGGLYQRGRHRLLGISGW
jgi:succinoglycan biosynthesis protein ExoA